MPNKKLLYSILILTIVIAFYNTSLSYVNISKRQKQPITTKPIGTKPNKCTTKNLSIKNEGPYCSMGGSTLYKQSLIINYPNGQNKALYTTKPPKSEDTCFWTGESIRKEFIISPDCSQVAFLLSKEPTTQYLINTKTEETIIESNENFAYIQEIHWSENGNYFAIVEKPDYNYGRGSRSVYVGNNYTKTNKKIFSEKNFEEEGGFSLYGRIFNVSVTNDGFIYFSTEIPEYILEGRESDVFSFSEENFNNNYVYSTRDDKLSLVDNTDK